jgi:hypothetical protein
MTPFVLFPAAARTRRISTYLSSCCIFKFICLLYIVNGIERWKTECHTCFIANISNRKVALANNIHANDCPKMPSGISALAHQYPNNPDVVWEEKIYQIGV